MAEIAARLHERLASALAPHLIKLTDVSHRHAGHAGHRPEGETHFDLLIVAAAFEGQRALVRHRMVNEAVAELLSQRVHALSIRALTPDEARSRDIPVDKAASRHAAIRNGSRDSS